MLPAMVLPRRGGPFVDVDRGAIPETRLESELVAP
jgi:hypothetical protein